MTAPREEVRRVSLVDRADFGLAVVLYDDGSVSLEGDDVHFAGGYEYFLTIREPDRPSLARALGISDDDDVLAALAAHTDALRSKGAKAWLDDRGVPYEFFSYY